MMSKTEGDAKENGLDVQLLKHQALCGIPRLARSW